MLSVLHLRPPDAMSAVAVDRLLTSHGTRATWAQLSTTESNLPSCCSPLLLANIFGLCNTWAGARDVTCNGGDHTVGWEAAPQCECPGVCSQSCVVKVAQYHFPPRRSMKLVLTRNPCPGVRMSSFRSTRTLLTRKEVKESIAL